LKWTYCRELHVTREEGTWASWLYDLLQPQVEEVLVCNPRRNALLKEGSKNDKVDARNLVLTDRGFRGMMSGLAKIHPEPAKCTFHSGSMSALPVTPAEQNIREHFCRSSHRSPSGV
jgi:hypothetical protein